MCVYQGKHTIVNYVKPVIQDKGGRLFLLTVTPVSEEMKTPVFWYLFKYTFGTL